jgi:hypothetical protein
MAKWTRRSFVLLVLGIWLGALAEAATDRPAIVIHLDDKAGVPGRVLSSARAEVEDVFQAAGIRITWKEGPAPADAEGSAGGHPAVTVMLGTMESPCAGSGCTLGLAVLNRRTAIVFSNRVDELARRHPIDPGIILGRVIAHEIGHLLLPPGRHAHHGLMRGEIEVGFGRPSRFTREEAGIIREALLSSALR